MAIITKTSRKPGRPPKWTTEIEKIVKEFVRNNPQCHAKDVKNELDTKISSHLVPSLSLVANKLPIVKEWLEHRPPEQKALDRNWSLGAMAKHNINPDVLPILMKIQSQCRKENKQLLTIREATWLSRLHPLIKDEPYLAAFARIYASEEEDSEITGTEFDTTNLDKFIPGNAFEAIIWSFDEGFSKPENQCFMCRTSNICKEMVKEKYDLDLSSLSERASVEYITWFMILEYHIDWDMIDEAERKDMLLRLKDWVKENEEDYVDKIPTEIIQQVEPGCVGKTKLEIAGEFERIKNEQMNLIKKASKNWFSRKQARNFEPKLKNRRANK